MVKPARVITHNMMPHMQQCVEALEAQGLHHAIVSTSQGETKAAEQGLAGAGLLWWRVVCVPEGTGDRHAAQSAAKDS